MLVLRQEEQKLAKVAVKRTRVTKQQVTAHRTAKVKDHSPSWDDADSLTAEQFSRRWYSAMSYYRMEFNGKDLKPAVLKWMATVGCTKQDIDAFKKTKDWRCSSTMGGLASCFLRGMPTRKEGFNENKDSAEWLRARIVEAIQAGKSDFDDEEEKEKKPVAVQPNIQARIREVAGNMCEELEDIIDSYIRDPEAFDPKQHKVLNILKAREVKAAHARYIKAFYQRTLDEHLELASGKADEQLKEGYSNYSKKQVRNFIVFLQDIVSACDMLGQEAKVNRKPRKAKVVPKDKIVAKMKYKKTDEPLKLVSVNPADIIGSKELWVYNTKSRKLGKYVAAEFNDLGVKGTTITGFSENLSICKTLRKPEEKLKEFKSAGKVQLRKFLDDINATDTKMNGRINEEIILLKVA